MDEILIEEKKYVSSKRAAKMTGYAKDYIGQLCREGRVPARLVGRSWYVLESAIQDHRFGDQVASSAPGVQKGDIDISMSPITSEFPRYEAAKEEVIPFINHVRNTEAEIAQRLQDSWHAWFDHVGKPDATEKMAVEAEIISPITPPTHLRKNEEKKGINEDNGKETNVPIHTIYKAPPREFLPKRHFEVKPHVYAQKKVGNVNTKGIAALKIFGVILATFSVITAAIGTGYFDRYIISINQVNIISGVTLYNK